MKKNINNNPQLNNNFADEFMLQMQSLPNYNEELDENQDLCLSLAGEIVMY